MKKLLHVWALALTLVSGAAIAQSGTQARVSDSDQSLTPNTYAPIFQTTTGRLKTNTTITGTIPVAPSGSSQTNASGTITLGGTFQTISAANTSRLSLEFHNVCPVSGNCTAQQNNCYLYIAAAGTPSTANSIIVPSGADYIRSSGEIPTDSIRATCDGTSDKYYLSVQ